MKKRDFTGMLAAGAAALLLSTVPASCTDGQDEIPSTGGRIGFAVDLWKEGSAVQAAQTKGAGTEADTLPAVSVIALEGEASGDGKPLYLHAVTTEGIEARTEETAGEAGGTGARTKAAPVDNATMYDEMVVTAFVYPASDSWPSAYTGGTPSAESYMRTVRVKKNESWNTSYYWPGSGRRISFFASAPYDCGGLTAFNDGASGNPPYLSYTVPAAVADQKDLLVASSTDRAGNTNEAEPLTMKHALTAVRFVTGDGMLPGTVSKITLKNVYSTGRLPLLVSPTWYEQGTTASFEQTLMVTTPDPNVPGTELTPEVATFMMLPQTLPTGAQIEVIYTDKLTGTQRTLTADIAGSTWPMGKTVTYRISTSSIVVTPVLEVTAPAEFTYAGGSKEYTVKSCMKVTRPGDPGKTLSMPWTVEYSTDDGANWSDDKPEWLTTFTASGEGSDEAKQYDAAVAAQEDSYVNPHTTTLKAAPQKTGWNLANATDGGDAVQNTANCYIVNAPGTYRLPLVYGNAVKNGAANTSAYTSTESGNNVLTPFINHSGAGITDPYIYNNANCEPANCTLVWQDEKDLVTGVALSSDKHFLEFTVDQSTIRQGNAVVAVRNASNTVLWSWHIWVTDYVPGTSGTTPDKEITNYQNKKYKIMSFNLGWCDEEKEIYAERTVKVRFKQTGTTSQQTITVKQKAHTITKSDNNTYFQWGRKDPFVGALAGNVNKTWYDANGNVKTNQLPPVQSFSTDNACITSSITLPNTFCTTTQMDRKYTNLWSANTVYFGNDDLVVKTIYDPCPIGYKMPPGNAFTGFTTTGQNTTTSSQFNVSGAWNKGYNFYCDPSKTQTVFFPALGWRLYDSAVPNSVGDYGVYWSAWAHYKSDGWRMHFSSSSVSPLIAASRSRGSVVRAAQE